MKKINLSSLKLNESNGLSTEEKRTLFGGGLRDDCPDQGQRCGCFDGGHVLPLDFCTFLCPPECPIHLMI